MTIQQAIDNFKFLVEDSVKSGGNAALTAMIRSSKPILNIHEAIKQQLIDNGVSTHLIFPPIGKRSPEILLSGSLKRKTQDICVQPNDIPPKIETLTDGLLVGIADPYGKQFTQRTLSINIRSQISSIAKNFDTLYERTSYESINLHNRCPKIVLGEVYMIAIPEYEDKAFAKKNIIFKNTNSILVEKYIRSFQAITGRHNTQKNFFHYESTCLLIVDFSQNPAKIYNSTAELIADGLLPAATTVQYEGLEWNGFSRKLLDIYDARFGTGKFT
jgi:hypothetical protein